MSVSKELRPRKTPRQDRSTRTRERILGAAARVFAEYGYAAGTTNRIADAAALSVGSLYQYFPNKDAILLELMTAHVSDGIARTNRALAGGLPSALPDALRVFVRSTIDNHRDEPELHRVLFEEAPRPPQFLATMHAAEQSIVEATAVLLAAHPEVGVADAVMAARMTVASIESLVHRLVASPDPIDTEQFEDELVDMLARYLRG